MGRSFPSARRPTTLYLTSRDVMLLSVTLSPWPIRSKRKASAPHCRHHDNDIITKTLTDTWFVEFRYCGTYPCSTWNTWTPRTASTRWRPTGDNRPSRTSVWSRASAAARPRTSCCPRSGSCCSAWPCSERLSSADAHDGQMSMKRNENYCIVISCTVLFEFCTGFYLSISFFSPINVYTYLESVSSARRWTLRPFRDDPFEFHALPVAWKVVSFLSFFFFFLSRIPHYSLLYDCTTMSLHQSRPPLKNRKLRSATCSREKQRSDRPPSPVCHTVHRETWLREI